jgi:DNA-binding NarL/FixJ family response regulator
VHQGGSPITSNIARKVVQFFRQHRPTTPAEDPLSPREKEVLELVTKGCPYKEIANTLKISVPTVSTYIRRTYEKLHVCCRAEAVAKYALMTHSGQEDTAPAGT